MSKIRLYAWQPGHGQYSFFVAAASEEEAMEAVNNYIAEHKGKHDSHYLGEYEVNGWWTNYYELTVLDIGEVITNDNS